MLLAACRSSTGASRHVCDQGGGQGWALLVSPYVAVEVLRNLDGRPAGWRVYWQELRPGLTLVQDVLTISNPVVFSAAKDKPILFSAYASADILLTLDSKDFGHLLKKEFYGLRVLKPADFLIERRSLGEI